MEYRRAAAGKQNLSVLVVTTKLHEALSDASLSTSVLGDAAKAISRKLREEDSIYILTQGHFGVILPGVDATVAKRVSARLVEGLTDAAGASNRFSFEVHAITYPEQASSAHDLELAVTGLLPEDRTDWREDRRPAPPFPYLSISCEKKSFRSVKSVTIGHGPAAADWK